jgi:serine-type D-Ala-D-Ala carboxypeptidase/endopeptidase (penicillin-binding protein 4)
VNAAKYITLFWTCFYGVYHGQINTVLEAWKADKDLKNATIGFCVMNAKTSEIISEYNAHTFLIPASTLKAVTTGAALGLLGTGFRYETRIYHTGNFNKETGTVFGDLIIYGTGDPTLQSESVSRDTNQITDKWAQILKDKGVKEVKGKIIGDASHYERLIPGNWIWADISNYFGVAPCALSYNENKFKIIYSSAEAGSKAKVVKTIPAYLSNSITINSNVIAKGSDDDAFVSGDPFSFSKDVNGKIPPNKSEFEVEAALPDPALLCAEKMYLSLLKAGIKCAQKIESNYKKPDSTALGRALLHTHFSPSLERIVNITNMVSHNLFCESILRSVGKGSFYLGIDAVKNYWQKKGVDVSELYMSDGSGLSRSNGVTTFFHCAMLSKIYKDSSLYKMYNASLPVAGKSGSMRNVGKGTIIENNMRAKTGYINRARGYCGYVKTKSGVELCFSVLFNNYNCNAKAAKDKIEKLLVELGTLD